MDVRQVEDMRVEIGSSAQALGAFWKLWDECREALDREMETVAARIPVFAEILAQTSPEARREQAELSRRLERNALLEGRWQPLAAHLTAQGEIYAGMGIPLPDWQRILGAFRGFLREEIEARHPGDSTMRLTLARAMDDYLDWAMGTLGASYVAERQKLVDRATGTVGLFRDLFEHASIGMQIYAHGVGAPTGADVFERVAANRNSIVLSRAGEEADDESSLDVELHERLREVAGSGSPAAWEATSLDERGVPRYLAMRAFALGDGHLGVLLEDVSSRRRLELARQRALESLERSNRELDHFAYVASHDLRAPLRDVDNLASWIEEDAADSLPVDSKRHFEQLRTRILRMERLLDDLLQYSRVGRHHVSAERIDTRKVVDAAIEEVGIPDGFEVVVEGADTQLFAPRVPLQQVLRNLLDNAIKHHGGETGRVVIGHAPVGAMIRFFVRDDGPGIAPEYHERIFAMFQTLRPRDETEGSGMGLALVKKIVERHGGAIEVDSSPGGGSEFSFTWPRRWQEAEEEGMQP